MRLRTELQAGSGPDDSSDEWRYEKQTEQLPLRGCKDEKYEEFESEADVHDSSYCLNMIVKNLSTPQKHTFSIQKHNGSFIFQVMDNALPITFQVYDVRGMIIKTLRIDNTGKVIWHPEKGLKGLHLIKVLNSSRVQIQKVLL